MARLGVFVACLVVALVAAESVAVETEEQTEGFWDTVVDIAGAALNAVNRIPVTPRPPAPPSTGTNGRPTASSPPPNSPALSTKACAGGSYVLTRMSGSFTWNNFNNPQSIGKTTYKSNMNKCYIVRPPNLAANEEVELTFARVDIASVDKLMVFDEATQKVVKSVRDTEGTFRSKKGFMIIFQTNNERKTKKGFLVSFGVRKTTPPSFGTATGPSGPFSVSIERAKNAKAHRTEYFDDTGALHARRGLPIEFVTVNGKIEGATLQAAGGPVVTICGGQKDTTYDSTCTPTATGFTLTFAVNAPIGAYSIVASSSGNRRALAVKVFLMFNPFSNKDSTYMRPADVQSYVVANSGYVYQSSYAKRWNFDQNTPNAVLTAFNGVAQLPINDRRSPLRVMRRISLDVGNNVLFGRWDGDYSDGEQPTSWSSSSAIFDKFQKSKAAVKYGQCWVFSALVVSYGRALGLPTRSVTNLDSAHEHGPNFDGICEVHYKKSGDDTYVKDIKRNKDSIWNFHVWNEGFTGGKWYAFDATPQEPSGPKREYQCGPYEISHLFAATKAKQAAPEITAAVNRAPSYQWDANPNYDGRFDGPFIHGETNCELVNLFEGKPIAFRNSPARDACKVGARTLTWSGTSNTAQNVAGCYKDDSKCAGYATCPRTSSEAPALLEVQAAAEAKVSALNRLSLSMRTLLDAVIQVDPEIAEEHASWLVMLEREGVVTGVSENGISKDDVKLPPPSLPLTPGLVHIPVGVNNLGPGRHRIHVQVDATMYTDKCANQPSDIHKEGAEKINPACATVAYNKTIEVDTPQFSHNVPVAALIPFMGPSLSFRFWVSSSTFIYDSLISFTPPPLAVAPSTLTVGKIGTVVVTVTNPLPVNITGGTVIVRVAGSTKEATQSVPSVISNGQVNVTVSVSVDQVPKPGEHASVTADLISPLISLTGNGKATILPRVSKLEPVVGASTKKGVKVYGSGAGAGAPPAPQAAPATPVNPKVSPVLSRVETLLGPL